MRWFVVCADYSRGPFKTEAEADRAMQTIVASGHCTADHRIAVGREAT